MRDTEASSADIADFTGTLVRRQYKPGQKFVQLVFQTAEGNRLAISRNAELVRALTPGETYTVRGQEYELSGKRYIHEPTATLLQQGAEQIKAVQPFIKRHLKASIATAVVAALALTLGVAALVKGGSPSDSIATTTPSSATYEDTTSGIDGTVQGASTTNENQTETPADTTPTTTTAAATTKPNTTTVTQTTQTPSVQQPVATQPTTPIVEEPTTQIPVTPTNPEPETPTPSAEGETVTPAPTE